jgi:ferredoxin-NADP reductase
MYLRITNMAVKRTNRRSTFHFSPASGPVHPPQSWQLADRLADGDYLHIAQPTKNFKIHLRPPPSNFWQV